MSYFTKRKNPIVQNVINELKYVYEEKYEEAQHDDEKLDIIEKFVENYIEKVNYKLAKNEIYRMIINFEAREEEETIEWFDAAKEAGEINLSLSVDVDLYCDDARSSFDLGRDYNLLVSTEYDVELIYDALIRKDKKAVENLFELLWDVADSFTTFFYKTADSSLGFINGENRELSPAIIEEVECYEKEKGFFDQKQIKVYLHTNSENSNEYEDGLKFIFDYENPFKDFDILRI